MVDIAGDMEGAAREIQQAHPGTQVIGVLGDASSEKDTIDLIDRVMKEQGRLDVFFANAGKNNCTLLHDITPSYPLLPSPSTHTHLVF